MAPGAAWCLVAKDSYLYLRRTPLLSTFYHTGFDHPTTFDHLPGSAHLRTGRAHLRTEIEHHTFTGLVVRRTHTAITSIPILPHTNTMSHGLPAPDSADSVHPYDQPLQYIFTQQQWDHCLPQVPCCWNKH